MKILGTGLLALSILFFISPAQAEKKMDKKSEVKKTAKKKGNPMVTIETSLGNIELELYEDKAKETVANFLKYVDEGFYDGTIFHRVINNFMIQGGGFTSDMKQKATKDPVKNEADNGVGNDRGTIAMARTSDPHSATAQFFINVKDNDFLNHTAKSDQGWGYTVFGKVKSGLDIVDKIKMVPTATSGRFENVPVTAVTINKVKRN